MLENVELLTHSAIKISKDKIIYIDPFKINEEYHDADLIFCTHPHFDHFSVEDIKKVVKETTKIVAVEEIKPKVASMISKDIKVVTVKPNMKYTVDGITFKTVIAYNIKKDFHPKKNNWLGYIIKVNGVKYYISGDTDNTKEAQKVKCDVAFLPVGGMYTMNYKEAADLANIIMPKIAVPTHYGSVVGSRDDATMFASNLNPAIDCEIMV